MTMAQASLLITMFMLGVILGLVSVIFQINSKEDQVILGSFLIGLMCSVFLPIAIFEIYAAPAFVI